MIAQELYVQILDNVPIVCVDAFIKNVDGQYLLAKRGNEPLKDEWWTIGGRINQGETGLEAIKRKIAQELSVDISEAKFIGIYEDFFDRNSFRADVLYHTVSLCYEVTVADISKVKLDSQHVAWKFADSLPDRLLEKLSRAR